jgi:hypothetical protein
MLAWVVYLIPFLLNYHALCGMLCCQKAMYQPLPAITEDLATLQARLRRERAPQLRPRWHVLVLLTAGQVTTRRQAAAPLAVPRNTVALWWPTYRDGGAPPSGPTKSPARRPAKRVSQPTYSSTCKHAWPPPGGLPAIVRATKGGARRLAWRCPINPCMALCTTNAKRS